MTGEHLQAAERRIRATFAAAGAQGALHARHLPTGASLGVAADQPVVLASVFKVWLVVALQRLADAGELDLREVLEVQGDRTAPTGIGAMTDPVRMSLRDLAYLALAISDNAAADALADRIGGESIERVLQPLALGETRLPHCARDFLGLMLEDLGVSTGGEVAAALARRPALLAQLRVRDPAATNASTPREATELLRAIWLDEAASAAGCAEIRRLMGLQVWPHRLSAGFPDDRYAVAGKTGTLPGIRNEIGVVETPHAGAVAVAVFTRVDVATAAMPQVDACIGATARIAVDALTSAR